MGREIRDVFQSAHLPAALRFLGADDAVSGVLTEHDGEPVVIGPLATASLDDVSIALLAGSAESTEHALSLDVPANWIDLTFGAEDNPRARLRAPLVEPEGYSAPDGAVHVIAHPAAIALALLLSQLNEEHPIERCVAQIFEPASTRGRAGINELQQQTVGLLAFKPQPKAIYDAQLAFNMLARYGDDAPEALGTTELRIERHLASLLSNFGGAPMPSLKLIQAPVFHGHTYSLWVEFQDNPGVAALHDLLGANKSIDVRGADLEPPHIVGIAGQSGVAVGAVTVDRNTPHACWIWAVADNLRLMADNALAVTRQLL